MEAQNRPVYARVDRNLDEESTCRVAILSITKDHWKTFTIGGYLEDKRTHEPYGLTTAAPLYDRRSIEEVFDDEAKEEVKIRSFKEIHFANQYLDFKYAKSLGFTNPQRYNDRVSSHGWALVKLPQEYAKNYRNIARAPNGQNFEITEVAHEMPNGTVLVVTAMDVIIVAQGLPDSRESVPLSYWRILLTTTPLGKIKFASTFSTCFF